MAAKRGRCRERIRRQRLIGVHASYLAHGGLDFLIGDGRLNYAPEYVWESYYSARVLPGFFTSIDAQHVTNPSFNHDRGPVWVWSLRLHLELSKDSFRRVQMTSLSASAVVLRFEIGCCNRQSTGAGRRATLSDLNAESRPHSSVLRRFFVTSTQSVGKTSSSSLPWPFTRTA